jgi:hypothetical protein
VKISLWFGRFVGGGGEAWRGFDEVLIHSNHFVELLRRYLLDVQSLGGVVEVLEEYRW